MKKIIIALVMLVASLGAKAQFPTTDSLKAFINRWIRNSAVEAFQNLRLNTALIGMTNFLDSAYGGQVKNFESVNDTTARLVTIANDTFSIFLRGNGITALRRRPGTDSVEYLKNGSGWAYAYKDSTGSSLTLNNIGTGYAILATPGGNFKRLNPGYGVLMDSTTTANTITVRADTTSANHLVTQSDLNDAVAIIRYTDVAYVDSAYGSDVTGALNRLDKPFATLDAALDAGASRPSLHIKIGFGSYAKPTPAKMRDYLWIEGSGKPGHNGVVSMIGYADFSNTAPTKLTGGTIIKGKIQSIDHGFVKISDLGVDQGSAFVAGGGTENDGIGIGSLTTTTPFPLMQGIEIDNVICLLKDPTSAFHGIVVENHIGFRINNCDVIFGTHGIVSKGMGGTITNCKVSDCATDAFIIKSDSYAYSWATQLSDFECASIFSSSCGGVYILASTGPAHGGIKVSNGTIRQCTYGVLAIGVNDALTISTVKVQGGTGIGFNFDATSFVQLSNCFARGTTGDGFKVDAAASGYMNISNCFAVGCGGDGFDLNTAGRVDVDNIYSRSNSGYGINVGSNVHVGVYLLESNSAGAVNGTFTNKIEITGLIANGTGTTVSGSGTAASPYTINTSGGTTLYTSDGTLASDRTVSTGGFTTTWTGSNDGETSFSVVNTGTTNASAISGTANGTTSVGVSGTSSAYIGILGNSTSNSGVQGQSSSGTGVIGVSSTGAGLRGQNNPTSTNAIENVITLLRTTSAGAGANGLGAAIQYELETATSGTSQIAGTLAFKWTDATNASRTSAFEIYGVNSATTARKAALAGNGQWTWDTYGAGTHAVTPATTPVISSSGVVGERVAPKIYTALLTQSGSGAPSATILGTNEIGSIVWTRNGVGDYTGTLTGAFTANKTFVMVQRGGDTGTGYINPWSFWADANSINIAVLDNINAATDGFTNMAIEIRVYP